MTMLSVGDSSFPLVLAALSSRSITSKPSTTFPNTTYFPVNPFTLSSPSSPSTMKNWDVFEFFPEFAIHTDPFTARILSQVSHR
ncbi:hypothetical protein BC829DRAFT_459744 [Chytridium lagenaria]|nr:hypothetical protein BC829DRAFT_459744 [Chytridium lagenaria]